MGWRGTRSGSQEEQVGRLVLAGILIVFLPSLPFGNYVIYPFIILTTWFHEMGHGLMALATGNQFLQLVILPDGSGVATSTTDPSGLSRALVSMGGPLGPSVVGALLILASSVRRYWKPTLIGLAVVIVLSTLVWVRSLTGWIVLPLVAALLVWVAWKGKDWLVLFSLQFLGVLAALSMFRDWDYLFSEGGMIGDQAMRSDTAAIAAELFLPYWVWAIVIIGLSGLMVGASLKYALNRQG